MADGGRASHGGRVNAFGELVDAPSERAYRDWSHSETVRHTRLGLWIAGALFALYAFADLLRDEPMAGAVPWRLTIAAGAWATAMAIGRLRTPGAVSRAVLIFELLAIPAHWVILRSHGDSLFATTLEQLLVVLGIYLLIPNRLPYAVTAAAFATVGYVALTHASLQGAWGGTTEVAMALLAVNCVGVLFGHRVHRLDRLQFLDLTEERRLREALEDEVQRREQLEDELRQLATTDSLTGAVNRRHFMELAAKEVNRSRRYGRPLSIMLIDLDNFKRINDTLGHSTGDQVLIRLARILRRELRKSDVFGRLGGDEFAVLAPELDEEAASQMADRLRAAMEFQLPDSELVVTISVGVARYAESEESIEPALQRADQALYRSKHEGRNRVALA